MKKIAILGLFVIGLMVFSAPAYAQDTSVEGTLVLRGSSTLFPIMQQATTYFDVLFPNVVLETESIGSGGGFDALLDGSTDIAPMSRAPKDTEIAEAAALSPAETVNTTQIGLDALAIIVNNNNPITQLSYQNITDIFNGTIRLWSALGITTGVSDDNIKILERDTASGTHDYFNEEFLNEGEVPRADLGQYHNEFNDQAALNAAVAAEDNAIGYSGLAYVDTTVKSLDVSETGETGSFVAPSISAASDGSYPVSRPLFLVTFESYKAENDLIDFFLEWILSEDGQFVVFEVGYVNIFDRSDSIVLPTADPTDDPTDGTEDDDEGGLPFEFAALAVAFVAIGIVVRRRR